MSERPERIYRAVIWTKDPGRPGEHVTVWAKDLEEARRRLEEEYGEGTVYDLYNEDDADTPR